MGGMKRTSRAGVYFILGLVLLPIGLAAHPAFVGIGAVLLVAGMSQIVREGSAPDGGDE